MKKHPVDDLFKRKLEGLERTPSENAWLKIQEKQSASSRETKRRPLIWAWYAAAGVAAAVMGGYLVWQNQEAGLPGMIKPDQSIAVAKPADIDSTISPVISSKEEIEALAVQGNEGNAAASNAPNGLTQAEKAVKSAEYQVARSQRVQSPDIKTPAAQSVPANAPVVAIAEKPSVPANAMQTEPANMPVAQDIKTLLDEPAVSRVNKPEPEPTRTIVVAVETGPSEVEEKPRGSRFARVFRQLKNARAGEKVDWEEVGFNPKNLVARVDDRLRSKDDKSLDKDHPKEKTKL